MNTTNIWEGLPVTISRSSDDGVSLSSIISGDIVVWQNGLHKISFLDDVNELVFQGISTLFSSPIAAVVRSEGLEKIHRYLSIPEIIKLNERLAMTFSSRAHDFFNHFFRANQNKDIGVKYYYADQAWIRIMVPEFEKKGFEELIQDQYGQLVAHNPHKDSWFSQAKNVINFWIAIGSVIQGNSILIYPDSYYERLEMHLGGLAKTQRLKRPINFSMSSGDVLLFHGDHLHSTELNFTDETRFVVSFRLTYDAPIYAHDNTHFDYKQFLESV